MLKRAALICSAVLCVVPVWAQSRLQIDAGSQLGVNQLAAVSQTIKECPRAITSERQWGRKSTEIVRWYAGPPQNVIWDVVPGSSIRSPYLGYIEFSLARNYWVPEEVRDKFTPSMGDILVSAKGGPLKHRYEFDLSPGGLELMRMLVYGEDGKLSDDSLDGTCWQKAAQNAKALSNSTTPIQATAGDVPSKAQFVDSGNEFLSQCDKVSERVADQTSLTSVACWAWFSGFATGVQAIQAAGAQKMVCLPEKYNNQQGMQVVLKYMRDHPGELRLSPAVLGFFAFKQAFPCDKR